MLTKHIAFMSYIYIVFRERAAYTEIFYMICCCRKRAEAEGRKGSFPCSKAMSSHHPTDPVELRRINFQTPGRLDTCVKRSP